MRFHTFHQLSSPDRITIVSSKFLSEFGNVSLFDLLENVTGKFRSACINVMKNWVKKDSNLTKIFDPILLFNIFMNNIWLSYLLTNILYLVTGKNLFFYLFSKLFD
ncbi:unnamed protein product [Rotaria socialis]